MHPRTGIVAGNNLKISPGFVTDLPRKLNFRPRTPPQTRTAATQSPVPMKNPRSATQRQLGHGTAAGDKKEKTTDYLSVAFI